MASFVENMKNEWSRSGIVLQIIIINLVIFIPLNLSVNFLWGLENYFVMPLEAGKLIYKPWTIVSSMFSHYDFSHIFHNMIWFYVFGRIFIQVTGFHHWTKVAHLYLLGGLAGALLLIPFANLIPGIFGGFALGASGAVMAIAVAVGFYVPNYPVNFILVGEIKIKWVVIFMFVTSTLIDLSDNVGGKIDHLGGAVFGMIYGLQLKGGKDISEWFTRLFSRSNRTKLKVVHSRKTRTDEEYNEHRHLEAITLDELLDKINKSGYDSLSKKEKETLHMLSKKR